MSLDESAEGNSSVGMNKTAVADASSDSLALSEASGDSMDMSLQQSVAPRKSILPFAQLAGPSSGSVIKHGLDMGENQTL